MEGAEDIIVIEVVSGGHLLEDKGLGGGFCGEIDASTERPVPVSKNSQYFVNLLVGVEGLFLSALDEVSDEEGDGVAELVIRPGSDLGLEEDLFCEG